MSMRGEFALHLRMGCLLLFRCQVGSPHSTVIQGEENKCGFCRQCPCTAEFAVPSIHVSFFQYFNGIGIFIFTYCILS